MLGLHCSLFAVRCSLSTTEVRALAQVKGRLRAGRAMWRSRGTARRAVPVVQLRSPADIAEITSPAALDGMLRRQESVGKE